jgi:hypothetical protein
VGGFMPLKFEANHWLMSLRGKWTLDLESTWVACGFLFWDNEMKYKLGA